MKKLKRAIYIFIASFIIASSLLSATSFASAAVSDAKALAAAFSAAKGAVDVTLGADITISSALKVGKGQNITLDLNGHTITSSAKSAAEVTGGILTIKNTAKGGALKCAANGVIVTDGFFEINGGKMTTSSTALITNGDNASIIISGGSVNSGTNGVEIRKGNLEIKGIATSVTAKKRALVVHKEAKSVRISGGTFKPTDGVPQWLVEGYEINSAGSVVWTREEYSPDSDDYERW